MLELKNGLYLVIVGTVPGVIQIPASCPANLRYLLGFYAQVERDVRTKINLVRYCSGQGRYGQKTNLLIYLSYLQDGVPRTAYKGVVVFRYKKTRRRIFLIASDSLKQLGL